MFRYCLCFEYGIFVDKYDRKVWFVLSLILFFLKKYRFFVENVIILFLIFSLFV